MTNGTTTTIASRDVLDEALSAAKGVVSPDTLEGLASPLDATMLGRLNTAWDFIQNALVMGFERGREQAQSAFGAAVDKVEELLSESGTRAGELQSALLERLQKFMQTYTQGMLAHIPISFEISDSEYKLTKVTCTQKVLFAGSIKTNLAEVFSLTSTGDIGVATEYSLL